MKLFALCIFAAALIVAALAAAAVRLSSANRSWTDVNGETSVILYGGSHKVTSTMLDATNQMTNQSAPGFRAQASDGNSYALDELSKQGPLVIIFIKDGCPCSQAAQPYYNRLSDAYGDRVRFFGVIDGDIKVAKRWSAQNQTHYPILCDPNVEIVHQYKATNSAYLAIVARGGKIEKYWPGYSTSMLRSASECLARLSATEPKVIDTTDASEEMYTGCPY